MAFKIYTKTGDGGTTALIGGTKVLKSHLRIDAYGTVDELNCHLGLLLDGLFDKQLMPIAGEIQDRLFTIGSSLACDPEKEVALKIPDLKETDVELLEQHIDEMNAQLPALRFFILPGGHISVSQAHVARCVCRRAERICVHLLEVGEFVDPLVIKYLNRLSDYLFVIARWIGAQHNIEEKPWKPRIES